MANMFDKCLYFNAVKFSRAINLLWDEAYRPLGLSPSHAYLMQFIFDQQGQTVKILAEKMGLKISTITRFVDVLSNKGLIERRKENDDKRVCNIYSTAAGDEIKTGLEQATNTLYIKIREILGEDDVEKIVSLLAVFTPKILNDIGNVESKFKENKNE